MHSYRHSRNSSRRQVAVTEPVAAWGRLQAEEAHTFLPAFEHIGKRFTALMALAELATEYRLFREAEEAAMAGLRPVGSCPPGWRA